MAPERSIRPIPRDAPRPETQLPASPEPHGTGHVATGAVDAGPGLARQAPGSPDDAIAAWLLVIGVALVIARRLIPRRSGRSEPGRRNGKPTRSPGPSPGNGPPVVERVVASPRPPGRPDASGPTTALAPPRTFSGRAYVIDGDTIVVRNTKIRLWGIDAPELDRPYGQKAKWAMVAICRGTMISVELDGETSHDRFVGICRLPDGTDIAAELVRRGLALDVPYYSGGRYRHLEPQGVRRRLHDPAAAWRYRKPHAPSA